MKNNLKERLINNYSDIAAVVIVIAICGALSLRAAPGITDEMTVSSNDEVLAMGRQSDGKVVFGGRLGDVGLLRRSADGALDSSFFTSWYAGGFNGDVRGLAIAPDDAVVVGGDFTNFDDALVGHIARLKADGRLDREFASAIGTGFDDVVNSVALLTDGSILVAGAFSSFNGYHTFRIAKLKHDGTLDESFNPGAGFEAPANVVIPDPPDLLVGGDFKTFDGSGAPPLLRLTSNGRRDDSFADTAP